MVSVEAENHHWLPSRVTAVDIARSLRSTNFNRNHDLGERTLEYIKPTGPTLQDAALPEERVEEDENRRRPAHQADAIGALQLRAGRGQQIVRLPARIALLGGEPAGKWFPVVVADGAAKVPHLTVDDDAMAVSLVTVAGAFGPVQNGARRIERGAQRPPVHAIDEASAVAAHLPPRHERAYLRSDGRRQLVVGIHRQHPGRTDLGEAEVALLGEAVELARHDARLAVARDDVERRVGAAAVDDQYLPAHLIASSVRAMFGSSL